VKSRVGDMREKEVAEVGLDERIVGGDRYGIDRLHRNLLLPNLVRFHDRFAFRTEPGFLTEKEGIRFTAGGVTTFLMKVS